MVLMNWSTLSSIAADIVQVQSTVRQTVDMIDAIVVINVMYHLSFKYHSFPHFTHHTHSTLTPNGIKIKCQGWGDKRLIHPAPNPRAQKWMVQIFRAKKTTVRRSIHKQRSSQSQHNNSKLNSLSTNQLNHVWCVNVYCIIEMNE